MAVDAPIDWLIAILLCSVRVAAWLVVAPPFSSRAVPAQLKALLSVAIALPLAPAAREHLPATDPGALVVALLWQVFVGAGLGFLCYLAFAAFQVAGDMLDLAGGFSITQAYDPFHQSMTSVLGRFYGLVAGTLLLVTNAWLLVWRGLLETFRIIPLDATGSPARLATVLRDGTGEMFLTSIQIAAPLLAVLFLADVGMGLASRVAPQLNVFANIFPLKILLTMALAGFSLVALPASVAGVTERMVALMGDVLAGSGGGGTG